MYPLRSPEIHITIVLPAQRKYSRLVQRKVFGCYGMAWLAWLYEGVSFHCSVGASMLFGSV